VYLAEDHILLKFSIGILDAVSYIIVVKQYNIIFEEKAAKKSA